MTPEQRKELDNMAYYARALADLCRARGNEPGAVWHQRRAEALTAALASCETCRHSNDGDAVGFGHTYCTKPGGEWNGKLMPLVGRCTGWEQS